MTLLSALARARSAHKAIDPLGAARVRAIKAAKSLVSSPAKVAVAVVLDANGNVLTVRQPDGSLAMPGGWLLDGEDPTLGAARECREETGFPASPVRVLFVATDEDGNVSAAVECQLQGTQGVPERGESGQVAWLPPADLLRETKYPKFNATAIEVAQKSNLTHADVPAMPAGYPKRRTRKGMPDELDEPTPLVFQGLAIAIDRPAGFVQTKLDPGTSDVLWTRTYTTDYGYIPGTCGGDEDELDVFVGPDHSSQEVWWFYIQDAAGVFDEFKLVLGCIGVEQARAIILAHIPEQYVYVDAAYTTLDMVKALLGQDPMARTMAFDLVGKALDKAESADTTAKRSSAALKSVLKAAPTYEGAKPLPPELTNHPALTAPMTELYPDPAAVGGWVGVIDGGDLQTPDPGWVAFVGEGGDALLWTEREEDGGVIGAPYAFRREDWQAAVADAKRRDVFGSKSVEVKLIQVGKAAPPGTPEEQFISGIVLEPETTDLQGEIYSAEVVRQSAHKWLGYYRNFDVQHKLFVNESMVVAESYLAPIDYYVTRDGSTFVPGTQPVEAELVKKGSWVVNVYVTDAALWAAVKRGEFNGWSMNGLSAGEPV